MLNLVGILLFSLMPLALPQSGNVCAPQIHCVTLTIGASPDIANPPAAGTGYNVYRLPGKCPTTGLPSGGALLNSALLTVLTYTDLGANIAGNTYCYYATAFAQIESGPTVGAQATIPLAAPGSLSGVPH